MRAPQFIGFLQAAGITFYVNVFAIAVELLQPWFMTNQGLGPASGIVLFLLAFVFSALVCGAVALVYPIYLVLEEEWKRAVRVIFWTAGWLFVFLTVILAGVLLT